MANKIRVPRFVAAIAATGALVAVPMTAMAVEAPVAQAAPTTAAASAPAFEPAWCHHWGCGGGWHHGWGPGPGWGGPFGGWGSGSGTGSGFGLPGIYVGS